MSWAGGRGSSLDGHVGCGTGAAVAERLAEYGRSVRKITRRRWLRAKKPTPPGEEYGTRHGDYCTGHQSKLARLTGTRARRILRLSPNPPMRSGLGVGTRGEGRGTRRPALDPINGAGGGLWLSLGAPMAVLGSGAGAGSAGQHAGEDNRGPGRCDSVGRLGSLVDVSGAVGAVRQAMAGLAIEPGRE